MARYVNADKVIDVMKTAYWDENMHSAKDDPCVIDAMIDWSIRQVKDAPTEDVAPVVHAYWLESYWGGTGAECSNCNYLIHACDIDYQEVKHDFEYCPYCGAKMDGDVDG